MGSSFSARRVRVRLQVFGWFLLSVTAFACSSPNEVGESPRANVGGSAGHAGHPPTLLPGAGGLGTSGSGGGFAGGSSPANTVGGQGGDGGASGGPSSGASSGGISAGGSAGSAGGSGGSSGAATNAACAMIKSEYAAALDKQLACKPNTGSQCTNAAAAAPGCECRVFIQPADPFAIENLSNVANGWFDADCSMPSCPAKCSTAVAGTCQADAKSPIGGRCVSP